MTRRSAITPRWSRLGVAGALLICPLVAGQACVFELAEVEQAASGGGASGATGTGGAPADWWDEDFAHRQRLGLAGEAEPVDDAVLPVFLDQTFPYDEVEPGGADLRFVDADGMPIPHEIERWEPAGDSLLWVRVPIVDAGDDDHLWLYWGNPGQPPGDEPSAVWAGYDSVVHMSDPPMGDGTVIDNPGDGQDHEATGLSAANLVEGVLGPAYRFDGTVGQTISATSSTTLGIPAGGQASLEGWFQWDGTTEGTLVVHEGCCLGYFVQLQSDGSIYVRWGVNDCCNGGADYDQGSVGLAAGSETDWHHYVVIFDRAAGTVQLYIDGSPIGDAILIDPGPAFNPQSEYRIGADYGGNGNFGGVLDETRFASFAYEESRITLYARAGRNEVIAYGEPQSLP